MLKIGIAADHGGFELKEKLKEMFDSSAYEVEDFGASSFDENDDYPDRILPLAEAISDGRIDKGIAVCGSGVGAAIVANKLPGVRASLITETYSAHQGVEHDYMNVLCIGGRVVGTALAEEIVETFLKAEYRGKTGNRFERRLQKVIRIEHKYLKS